jgi:hypothetical protein
MINVNYYNNANNANNRERQYPDSGVEASVQNFWNSVGVKKLTGIPYTSETGMLSLILHKLPKE